jgi:hypothetical protein
MGIITPDRRPVKKMQKMKRFLMKYGDDCLPPQGPLISKPL